MEWILYGVAVTPLLFLPLITFDIFSAPQAALCALLSAAGVVVLGAKGCLALSLPTLLIFLNILYLAVNTLWTEVLDGARKEFALQSSLLLLPLLVLHSPESATLNLLLVLYGASLLSQIYAFGQAFGIDWLFPYRLEMKKDDYRPIGTIGNTNFFASYILPSVWIGFYLAKEVSPLFLAGVVLSLFLLHKTKCRGSVIGLAVSVYFYVLVNCYKLGYDLAFLCTVGFGCLVAVAIAGWFVVNWNEIQHTRINHEIGEGNKNPRKAFKATLRYRLCYWRVGWEMFLRRPWHGYGLRSYRKLVYYEQARINDKEPDFLDPYRYITPQPRECHNEWLEDLVELGIAGVLFRWLLIGLVFYYGLMADFSQQTILLMTALVAITVHAVFFFGLRIPSTGLVFWLLVGIVLQSSKLSFQLIEFPAWITLLLIPWLIFYWWETSGKTTLASYYFMKFNTEKADSVNKELYMKKTLQLAPEETIYNTHMMIGYLFVAPQLAYKYAEQMWSKYDGMTPGWVMHYNMGIVAEAVGNLEFAFRHFATSNRLLPTFAPSIEKLRNLEPKMPFPQKGEIVKVVREEAKLSIQLLIEKLNNLRLQMENLQLQMQNVVIAEAARLNIPERWNYVPETGMFLSPDEFEAYQNQMKQQQQGQIAQIAGEQPQAVQPVVQPA